MSLRINHNTSAINAHRNLQMNDINLSKSLEKLSSGLKINRASDGPASLVISEQIRAQVAGLNQAVSNSETAISMVQTTEAALNEVNRMLVNMRQLAIHAANEGANDVVMLEADQAELQNSLETIDRVSTNTQFGTKKVLDGSNGANGTATGDGVEFMKASVNTISSNESGFDVIITDNATKSKLEGTVELTDQIIAGGEILTIVEGGKSAKYKTTDLDNIQTTVQNLNYEIKRVGLKVDVNLTEDNRLVITHETYGSEPAFQVSSSTTGILSQQADVVQNSMMGSDIKGTINGESAIGKGQILIGQRGAKTIDGLQVRYIGRAGDKNGIIDDDGALVGQIQVSQNSLTFQVGANRNQEVRVSLINTASEALGKGIENVSGFAHLKDLNLTTSQGAQDSLLLIDRAINEISFTRAELGAFQKNTLESNLSNLRIASENLVSAESGIRDVDMAAEMATFTKNQIMMQTANAMLAQANQVPKNVLTLLNS